MAAETVFVETLDRVSIEVEVSMSSVEPARATVVIGHPHPLHGGDMRNNVVVAISSVAVQAGCNAISVNFRGVGASGGAHDDGDSERLDLAAACDLAELIAPDIPVLLAGYSFGAAVALNVVHPRAEGWLAVAPPAGMLASRPASANSHQPKILACPEHDQFGTPEEIGRIAHDWINACVLVVPGVDHFLLADAAAACEKGLAALLDRMS